MPQRIAGYAVVEEATYTPETVFDYLNGGAEIYLSYGMEAVLGRRYAHPEEPELLLDVFDLGSSENAFGMFSQEQENPTREIGQTSEYTPGLLRFWKGRFFVAITATGLTDGATAATLALGRACAAAIAREGVQPELLNSLPAEGLVEARVRFVRTASALSRHYDLAGGDILGLGCDARAVLAEYERSGGRAVLLLVECWTRP